MKLPYSWLKELVPQLPPVNALEPVFAQLGLPLEGVQLVSPPPAGVLLVTVLESGPIEGSKLSRIRFDTGSGGERVIASGAPNATELPAGAMLALVSPGTELGGQTYGVRRLQGVESWGMAASFKELGLGDNNSGLAVFPAGTAPNGTPLRELWPDDAVLDIEVTPNRADALSALGVARDLAAFLRLELVPPPLAPASEGEGELRVTLPARSIVLERDPAKTLRFGCDVYAAKAVSSVNNGPAPLWMQRRLTLCGLRTRDLLVDTSNYVMLELGQPNALYDRRDVTHDHIIVGFGMPRGEEVADLLGGVHQVGPEDLLILDGHDRAAEIPSVAQAFATPQNAPAAPDSGVLGIAGIVGGARGQVRKDTRDVVIETAHFDSVLLRRTANRLGLKTDAVYRFERGVDPLLPQRSAERIAELLRREGGHPERGITVVGSPALSPDIALTGQQVRDLLGMDISTEEMRDSLQRLGAGVQQRGDELRVTPPSWRVDMTIWQDVAEEVARLHGLEDMPETLPHVQPHPANRGSGEGSVATRQLKSALSGLGFQEVVTYTFSSDAEAQKARSEALSVKLQNPMSEARTGLRSALYPSLLRAAAAFSGRALLFEVGHVFPSSGEKEHLGLLMRGDLAPRDYQAGVAGGYRAFRGLLETFAAAQGATLAIEQLREDIPAALHPGIAGAVIWNGRRVGWLGALHPAVAAEFSLKGDTFLLEVTLPLPSKAWHFSDPSRAPAALRDLAVVAPSSVSYGEIMAVLTPAGSPLLESVEPFDVYTGEQVGAGQRSVAVRLTYRSDRTLTDEEIDRAFQAQIDAVRARGWDIRDH